MKHYEVKEIFVSNEQLKKALFLKEEGFEIDNILIDLDTSRSGWIFKLKKER